MEPITLPIGTALTTVDLPDQTVLLEVNEAIIMEDNQSSLLSTSQVHEYGHKVHDVARRHGDLQCIEADDFYLPMGVYKGLFMMKLRRPTEQEKEDYTRIVLTADQI